jgi:hypothetical protein
MKRLLISMSILLLLGACAASGPTIHSDYDHTVDFSQYRTYNYFSPLGIEGPNYTSLIGETFRDAIGRQMQSRGYTLSDDPDLLINVSARLEDKTKVTTYNDPYPYAGGYYGYRRGFYDPWMGYGYGTETHVSQYTEGTVNVDMVDARAKRMVWEGVAIGKVDSKKSNDELKVAIRAGVTEMFNGYPFRAGSGQAQSASQ